MLNKSNKSLNLHGLLHIVLLFSLFSPLFDVDTNFIYFSHWINMKTIFVYIGASDSTSSHKNVHINFFFISSTIKFYCWSDTKKKAKQKTNDGAFIKSRKKKIQSIFHLNYSLKSNFSIYARLELKLPRQQSARVSR